MPNVTTDIAIPRTNNTWSSGEEHCTKDIKVRIKERKIIIMFVNM
jgi:hypothetical protein